MDLISGEFEECYHVVEANGLDQTAQLKVGRRGSKKGSEVGGVPSRPQ